ncbi:nucleotide sugar dehydrogenase [Alphaproteobacteria bacterium]|nr:nucleotide sugar dehydrogenase [Alphaproteobacteria bacterium]
MKISVIGLGYVGFPLAVALGKKWDVIGFDTDQFRINELNNGFDRTGEVDQEELSLAGGLTLTSSTSVLREAEFYIVTVPTPVDQNNKPDLKSVFAATKTVAASLKPGDIVVYECTVYPGLTEEECVPILEEYSGLKLNEDFSCGYSPERINPGDKEHRLSSINKIISASNDSALNKIRSVYESIITAEIYCAPSIKVAEAAKVIENTQRDLNIALINELAMLFKELGIDTEEVLKAAETKWNFIPFRPGLVGGHCIGVDPYYLVHKANLINHPTKLISSGRNINDEMPTYVANQIKKELLKRNIDIASSKILVMGITFKENCPDIRNTKTVELIHQLQKNGAQVDVTDPHADANECEEQYGIKLSENYLENKYDAVILTVAHDEFKVLDIKHIRELGKPKQIIYDLKYTFPKDQTDIRL